MTRLHLLTVHGGPGGPGACPQGQLVSLPPARLLLVSQDTFLCRRLNNFPLDLSQRSSSQERQDSRGTLLIEVSGTRWGARSLSARCVLCNSPCTTHPGSSLALRPRPRCASRTRCRATPGSRCCAASGSQCRAAPGSRLRRGPRASSKATWQEPQRTFGKGPGSPRTRALLAPQGPSRARRAGTGRSSWGLAGLAALCPQHLPHSLFLVLFEA